MFQRTLLTLALALLLMPAAGADTTTGVLSGTVVDFSTQKPVANVMVAAVSPSASLSAHTNARGEFYFLNMLPGRYTVTFSHALFQSNRIAYLEIHAGFATHVIVALKRQYYLINEVLEDGIGARSWPAVTADRYGFSAVTVTTISVNGEVWSVLRFVPGVQVGPAVRVLP